MTLQFSDEFTVFCGIAFGVILLGFFIFGLIMDAKEKKWERDNRK